MATDQPEPHVPRDEAERTDVESSVESSVDSATSNAGYYDLPVVKAAPWKWFIAAYFYAGGVAGAASTLCGAVQLRRDRRLASLVRKLRWISLLGEVAGAGLLIADLGKPQRFHHMLRVVRPTSPMNVGTWILSAAGATSALEVARVLLGRAPARLDALGAVGMVTGASLATYTGVLVGNTAIPVWRETRNAMPLLFAASSGASAAALLELIGASNRREAALVRRFSIAAKVAELAAARAVERAAGSTIVGAPLREGRSGALWRGARYLQAASLAATLLPGRTRIAARVAGALGTASGLVLRFAVLAAGRASAVEPRATLEPQRADVGA